MAAILRYGSYVPFCRLDRACLAGSGRGERSVASFDEDATSLAVEAGREAVRGCDQLPSSLLFASTSHPYAKKLNAAAVHAALDLPAGVRCLDIGSTARSGLSALALGVEVARPAPVLVFAPDVVVGAPSGPRESSGGDAACCFLIGDGPEAGAEIISTDSHTGESLDVWRGPDQGSIPIGRDGPAVRLATPTFEVCSNNAIAQFAKSTFGVLYSLHLGWVGEL